MAFLEDISVTDEPMVFLVGGDPRALGEDRALIFDAVISESETFSSTITKHPISKGRSISDHIISNNPTFSFRCIISDNPIDDYDNNVITSVGGSKDTSQYGDLRSFRSQSAYRTLKKINDSKEPFTIVTTYATYPNCVIKNMTFNKGTLAQLDVSLSIEKLRIATTEFGVDKPVVVEKSVEDDMSGTEQKGQGKVASAGGVLGLDLKGEIQALLNMNTADTDPVGE